MGIIKKLLDQQKELIHLISIACITSVSHNDQGQLNNLQRALKLNQEILESLTEKL